MDNLKQVMVRLPPDLYENLRSSAYEMHMPTAVLARLLIKQQLETLGKETPTVAFYEDQPEQTSESSESEDPSENLSKNPMDSTEPTSFPNPAGGSTASPTGKSQPLANQNRSNRSKNRKNKKHKGK